MKEHKAKAPNPAQELSEAASEVQGTAAAPEETKPAEVAPEAKDSPEKEIERLKDQLLRALAEAENTRRRLNKELEDTRKYAVSNFAKEMLVVADNFRRALEAIPKDGADNDTLKHLIAGVEATERQLLNSFAQFGIKKIDPLGQPFDPHFHRVMLEIEDPDRPAGTVVQVIQSGYMIHDRLLREAQVAVSKGGPAVHKVDTEA
jgi:molecular chaperone GrpE